MSQLDTVCKFIKSVSVLRRLLFAVTHLPSDLPDLWKLAVEYATEGKTSQERITPAQAKVLVDNIHELDVLAFSTDKELLSTLLKLEAPSSKPLGLVLISSKTECSVCGSNLQLRKQRPASIVLYDDQMGTIPASHYHKMCSDRACGTTQFFGYTTQGASRLVYFDSDWESLPYFVTSRESAFAVQLLRLFDSQILIGQMSFMQCAEAYNYLHTYADGSANLHAFPKDATLLRERQRLDRRRAEAAYFQYAVLRVASWYPERVPLATLPLHGSLESTLTKVTEQYHGVFMKTNAKHECGALGCGHALVVDGNMKNHRDVCFAKNAGYVEFKGLPGRVRSGCPNTPAHKSRYCSHHKPVVATPHQISPDTGLPTPSTSKPAEDQVGLIIGKRETRSSTLYQVVWLGTPATESTWEHASSLPQNFVEDFERGVQHSILQSSSTSGGQTVTAISTSRKDKDDLSPPNAKRQHTIFETSNSGVFEATEVTKGSCNTEKDRIRLNYRTAGILVGAWPCGTINMVAELYGAESKPQVYGALHTFLQENKEEMANLRYILYDDGCHLKKYALNPTRSMCTPTSEWLASLEIVVDKLHFKGHIDTWCHQHCNPYTHSDLENVDTEVCEQIFSWLSRYARITQSMNQQHFLFYILYLCDAHNRKRLSS